MPLYEYRCTACGFEFEEMQKITDDPVRTCKRCRADAVERLISRTSFQLKGGGWYADLYSSPRPKKEGSGDRSGSKKGAKESSK